MRGPWDKKMLVVEPADTPKGHGLRTNEVEQLWAFTGCCEADIHFNSNSEAFCSRCQRMLGNVSKVHSSWVFLDVGSNYLRDWVANWTGFDKDNIEVHVKS